MPELPVLEVRMRRVGQELNNAGSVGYQAGCVHCALPRVHSILAVAAACEGCSPYILHNQIAWQVRYDRSNCTKDMRIKFMTDGILLREACGANLHLVNGVKYAHPQ